MFRFTIRDVLWLTAMVAVCLGWWLALQHQRQMHLKELSAVEAWWQRENEQFVKSMNETTENQNQIIESAQAALKSLMAKQEE